MIAGSGDRKRRQEEIEAQTVHRTLSEEANRG